MKFTIYGKTNCTSCVQAKQLLESVGLDFEYKQLGNDFELLEMYDIAPRTHKAFPMIVKDGEYLGGIAELKQLLNK